MSRRKKYRDNLTVDGNRQPVRDAFSNPAARIGFGTMDLLQGTQYTPTRMTQNYELLTTLYRENWIVQNVIATIPDDIIRKWYELKTAISPELIDRYIQQERRVKLREKVRQGMYWGRLYGGAAGIMMIKGQDDMSKPLDMDMVTPDSFLGLQILDRWTGVFPSSDLVTDPEDPDFGLPAFYTVRDEERNTIAANVHHSRVLRFTGRELPWLEQITELYWGESELEAIYEELVRRDNVAANIAALTFRANVNYMESDGLDQVLGTANTEMQRRFWNTLQAQQIMESNFGLRVINKGDAIHNTQYTFTGLSDVYDRVMMDVAGAARTPVTKLFGRSPAGLNATGESDMKNYYDYLDGVRETSFRAIIERLLPVLALSAWGAIPDDLDIDFPALDTPNALEVADVAQRKTGAIVTAYQSDLIDLSTAREELHNLDEETGLFGKIPNELMQEGKGVLYSDRQQMADPLAGLTLPTAGEETQNTPSEPPEAPESPLNEGEGGN